MIIRQVRSGLRLGLPIGMGYFPIAVAFGALAVQAGLIWWEAVLMSVFVYAGASQFVGISMLLAGAGILQITTATLILNLRHFVMSMSVNYRMRSFPDGLRRLFSLGITDETFAVLTLSPELQKDQSLTPLHTAGIIGAAYSGWVTGTAAGALGAECIPEGLTTAMTVGLYALFIGLLIPSVRSDRKALGTAAGGMALSGLLSGYLSPGWAVVLAALAASGFAVVLQGGEG